MVYWFADFPAEPAVFPYNTGQFQRDWDALVKLAEEIATATNFALTGTTCKGALTALIAATATAARARAM